MLQQQGQASKRSATDMQQGGDHDVLLESIRATVEEENQLLTTTFDEHCAITETRQEQLEHRIEQVERKLGRTPGDGTAMGVDLHPQYLEVKGFCS